MRMGVSFTALLKNLYTNAAKYALENTRVYVELEKADEKGSFYNKECV